MARVLKGSHSFTCTPRIHPLTEWTIPVDVLNDKMSDANATNARVIQGQIVAVSSTSSLGKGQWGGQGFGGLNTRLQISISYSIFGENANA